MTTNKRPLWAGVATAACGALDQLADDVILLSLSHLPEPDLAAMACTSRRMLVLVAAERARLREERAALAAERAREHRALLLKYEGDVRILATVLRYMLVNTPASHSFVPRSSGSGLKLIRPPPGVCRVNVGIADGVTVDPTASEQVIDALAIQKQQLRSIPFQGGQLGSAGAAAAVRQARALQLTRAEDAACFHGKAFSLLLRGDVIRDFLASSPALAKLVSIPSPDEQEAVTP